MMEMYIKWSASWMTLEMASRSLLRSLGMKTSGEVCDQTQKTQLISFTAPTHTFIPYSSWNINKRRVSPSNVSKPPRCRWD